MSNTLSNYGLSPQGLQDDSTRKQTVERIMVLQGFAQDFCILKAVRDLREYLHEYGLSEDELPTDAYYFSSKIISTLEKLSDDENKNIGKNVLDTFKKWVIYKSLQEIWSYAIECPGAIHDLHHGPVTDIEDSLDNAYRATDRPDARISRAYEQARRKRFLNKLTKANRGTPLYDEKILKSCLEIASHVGRIKDNTQIDEDKVVEDLFGQKAYLIGIEKIEEDAGFNQIVSTIKNYLPNDILGCVNSAFLYNLAFTWQRLFSDPQSDIFDVVYGRISKIEDMFISSKSSQSMLDYRHECLTYILNKIKKVKTDIRMQELWDLSRDPSPIQISATLRSLDALDAKIVFKLDSKTKQKKNANEPQLIVVRKDSSEITVQGEVEVGEHVTLVCSNLKPGKKYELLVVTKKGIEVQRPDLTAHDGSVKEDFTIDPSFGGEFSIYLRPLEKGEKNEKIMGPALTIVSSSRFWSVEEPTYTVWWNYLRYFSLLSEPGIAQLFKFALDNATIEEKHNLNIDKIIPSAMFPETFDPPYNSASISTLDFDKITRNNSLIGERLKKTGELKSALSGVTAL